MHILTALAVVSACSPQTRSLSEDARHPASVGIEEPCEPVGCREGEFLRSGEFGLFTPYKTAGEVAVELPFLPKVGAWFGLVDDGQFFAGRGVAEVVRVDEVDERIVAYLSLAPDDSEPFSIMGPFDEIPGRTYEVQSLPERLFETRVPGNPTVLLAASSGRYHAREVSLRCGCKLRQQQSWYWNEKKWCLARSTTQDMGGPPNSAWCGDAPIRSESLATTRPVDAAFCPPTKEGESHVCSLDGWFATGAGNSIGVDRVHLTVKRGTSAASRFQSK